MVLVMRDRRGGREARRAAESNCKLTLGLIGVEKGNFRSWR